MLIKRFNVWEASWLEIEYTNFTVVFSFFLRNVFDAEVSATLV